MYSWGTSAPETEPVFSIVTVMLATVSQRSVGPPTEGMAVGYFGREVVGEAMWREE